MNTSENWSREATLRLIEEWEGIPLLYNTKDPQYFNKHARASALDKISKALTHIRPGTTTSSIKSKLQIIRGQYSNEKKKISERKSGMSTDDIKQSTLWCFNNLEFLDKYIKPRKSESNLEIGQKAVTSDENSNMFCNYEYLDETSISDFGRYTSTPLLPEVNLNTVEVYGDDNSDDNTPSVPKKLKCRKRVKITQNESEIEFNALKASTEVMEKIAKKMDAQKEQVATKNNMSDAFCTYLSVVLSEITDDTIVLEFIRSCTILAYDAKQKFIEKNKED